MGFGFLVLRFAYFLRFPWLNFGLFSATATNRPIDILCFSFLFKYLWLFFDNAEKSVCLKQKFGNFE